MGFFSKLFSAIDDSIQKTVHLVTHPSEAMALKEDLVTPRDVSYQGFFKKVDPVLDILSPSHNIVQEWTTGSATTEGQSPYFEKIAPIIVSWFFPTAGAFASGVDGVSQGNTQQAIIGFTSYGISSYSTALNAANADVVANGGTVATSTLSNLQTAQTIGKVVQVGIGAYNLYNANDQLMASTGRIMNMVSDTQQSIPAYANTFAGQPYGNLIGATGSGTNDAANAMIADAEKSASDRLLLVIGVGVGFLYFLTRSNKNG